MPQASASESPDVLRGYTSLVGVNPSGLGRVLVADDEAALAELIATMLTESGYEVRVAHSVGEPKSLIAQREFDVALLGA